MIYQEMFNDAYTLWFSGAAKMKNDKEIWWKDVYFGDITIEFPTRSSSYAVVRRYRENGNLRWQEEYQNGLQHGKSIGYYTNGNICWQEEYQNGLQHGKYIGYYDNGNICWQEEYQNGKSIK